MEIVAAIIGVILGFGLSELSQWWRETRKETSHLNTIRHLLGIEIQHNLDIVVEIRRAIMESKPESEGDAIVHRCQRFAGQIFPDFHDRAFVSQSSGLVSSLTVETTARMFTHYDLINAMEALRKKMEFADAQQDQAWMMAGGGRSSVTIRLGESGPDMIFNKSCAYFWKKLDQLLTDIERNGNPMK
jgi:hypothetical protein